MIFLQTSDVNIWSVLVFSSPRLFPLDGLLLRHGKFPPLHLQKVLQHLLPVLGEDGLGVELDAVDGQFAVGESHVFALWGFASAGSS